jgi:hypothetical protein
MASRKALEFSLSLSSAYPLIETNDLREGPDESEGTELMPLDELLNILQPYDPAEDLAFFNSRDDESLDIEQYDGYKKWVDTKPLHNLPEEGEDLRLWVSGASKNERTRFALSALRKLQAAQPNNTQADGSEKRTQVLYFLCNRYHDLRNTASSILTSCIHQLLQQRPDLSHVVHSYLQEDRVRYSASDFVPALSKVLRQFW